MRSFLRAKKSDSNLALLGPINDRSVPNQETTEVKGSLATLAREMAKQQMLRDQQRESEGQGTATLLHSLYFTNLACRRLFCQDPIPAYTISRNQGAS